VLSGQPGLQATRWESVSGGWLDGSPSYAAGLTRGSVLPSEQEWRIRAVLAGRGAGMTVDEVLATDEVAGRTMAMIRGWASDGLTRYDGDVSGRGIPGPKLGDASIHNFDTAVARATPVGVLRTGDSLQPGRTGRLCADSSMAAERRAYRSYQFDSTHILCQPALTTAADKLLSSTHMSAKRYKPSRGPSTMGARKGICTLGSPDTPDLGMVLLEIWGELTRLWTVASSEIANSAGGVMIRPQER
jgi:hypothetical protein